MIPSIINSLIKQAKSPSSPIHLPKLPPPLFSRLVAANIPWTFHFTTLTLAIYLIQDVSNLKTFLLLHTLITFFLDTEALLSALQNPLEPPLIPHPYLPFIGHALGMFYYGASYIPSVNAHTNHPIFALQTLTARTIVVVDASLAATTQRASKNTSFYGMILEVTKRWVDLDDAAMQVIKWNLDGTQGAQKGLMHESSAMVAKELSPGPALDALTTVQLEQYAALIEGMVPRDGANPQPMSLMSFVKDIFTSANAYSIYGPHNPFVADPSLIPAFWTWEAGMVRLMATSDFAPALTARKPWLARQALNAALEEYIESGTYQTASPVIQKHVEINLKHGLAPKMAAHAELILLFGILANAVPTAFWVLTNLYARPELLARIREETSRAVEVCAETGTKTIRLAELKVHAQLLTSTIRETIRTIANLSSVRLVTHTHTVSAPQHGRSYLLHQGSIIQIASGVIHTAPSIWGDCASQFKAERFLDGETATTLPKGIPSSAFRGFGGGSVICPGRHFAMNQMLSFVALCVQALDIVDAGTGEVFALPAKDEGKVPLSVMKPVEEPHVMVKRRKGEEHVFWRLEL